MDKWFFSSVKRAAVIGAGGVLALAIAGIAYQTVGSRRDRRKYPPLGRLAGSRNKLHLHCTGSGAPVVILEAGIAGSCISWQPVQSEIARFTGVCSYDRAGLGWSEEASGGRDLRAIVNHLREALQVTGMSGPFVLVGHSFGGLVMRAFAAWYPEEVAGLVLVDPVRPADWIGVNRGRRLRLGYGVMLSRRGAWLARLGVVRATLAMLQSGSRFLPKAIATAASGPGTGVINRMIRQIRKLPEEFWPMIQAQWCDPRAFRAMAAYLRALPQAAADVSMCGHIRSPVTILSAGDATNEQIEEWERLAKTAPCGTHVRALNTGHWLQLDDPELVVEAVHEHVTRFRTVA